MSKTRTQFIKAAGTVSFGLKCDDVDLHTMSRSQPGHYDLAEGTRQEVVPQKVKRLYKRLLKHWTAKKHARNYGVYTNKRGERFKVQVGTRKGKRVFFYYYTRIRTKYVPKGMPSNAPLMAKPYSRVIMQFKERRRTVIQVNPDADIEQPIYAYTQELWEYIGLQIINEVLHFNVDNHLDRVEGLLATWNTLWSKAIQSGEASIQTLTALANNFIGVRELNSKEIDYFFEPTSYGKAPLRATLYNIVRPQAAFELVNSLFVNPNAYSEFVVPTGRHLRSYLPPITVPDAMAYLARARVYRNIIRGAPAILTNALEMPETLQLFTTIVKTLFSVCKAIKAGSFKDAFTALGKLAEDKKHFNWLETALAKVSSFDLMFKFGIMPLINEIQAAIELYDQYDQYSQDAYLRRRARYPENGPWAVPYNHDDIELTYTDKLPNGLDYTVTVELTKLVVQYRATYMGIVHITHPIRFLLEGTGMTNFLGTAWEIVPLSFVVDWFIGFKDALSLFASKLDSYRVENEMIALNAYITGKFKITDFQIDTGTDVTLETVIEEEGFGQFEGYSMVRYNYESVLNASDQAALLLTDKIGSEVSTSKLVTAAELILQRML